MVGSGLNSVIGLTLKEEVQAEGHIYLECSRKSPALPNVMNIQTRWKVDRICNDYKRQHL